jgi:NodT family efflux transporter outer membrane factor (OMF) lipoprotein
MSRLAPLSLFALFAAAACSAVGPDYAQPESKLPPSWRENAVGVTSDPADVNEWWSRLADPDLDRLVARVRRQSLDLRAAYARVREARALRGVAGADRFPTVDATASFSRSGESDNTPFGSFIPDSNNWALGFDATWELDVWGRVRRSVEAADADLAATVEDARDVEVSVAAETAVNYVELRAFQRRADIARNNLDLQEQTLALVRSRFEAGLVSESDVAQAATSVESTRSRVPSFEVGARLAENRLAVLLGLTPGALAEELAATRPIPVPPVQVAVGVPADLLRRRADVRRAERQLAAETARIGVAEGDLYPRLMLNGNIGLEAEDLDDLFKSSSSVWGFGPSLRWNIFDAGRLRQRVAAQDARTEQALIAWEQSVLGALEETENAMTSFLREQARRNSLLQAATQARRAVELARTQYTEGLSDFQAVLVSERAVADLEDQLAESDAAIATDLIALYKALGGGWQNAGVPPAQ